ncbi:MAG: antitoxin [Angustibacter sp.]
MSTQMTVRIEAANAAYIDELVATGQSPSRAAVVNAATARYRQLAQAARDAEIYAKLARQRASGQDVAGVDDLMGFVEYMAENPLEIA